MRERAMANRIIKREHLFEMRSGGRKPADRRQYSSGAHVTQNEAGGIVVLTAYPQQILGQPLRHIEFAPVHVIEELTTWDMKKCRRGTQLLPELSSPGIVIARFRRRVTLEDHQGGPQA